MRRIVTLYFKSMFDICSKLALILQFYNSKEKIRLSFVFKKTQNVPSLKME